MARALSLLVRVWAGRTAAPGGRLPCGLALDGTLPPSTAVLGAVETDPAAHDLTSPGLYERDTRDTRPRDEGWGGVCSACLSRQGLPAGPAPSLGPSFPVPSLRASRKRPELCARPRRAARLIFRGAALFRRPSWLTSLITPMNDSFRGETAPERRREGGIQGKLSGAWFPRMSWLLLGRQDGRGGRTGRGGAP